MTIAVVQLGCRPPTGALDARFTIGSPGSIRAGPTRYLIVRNRVIGYWRSYARASILQQASPILCTNVRRGGICFRRISQLGPRGLLSAYVLSSYILCIVQLLSYVCLDCRPTFWLEQDREWVSTILNPEQTHKEAKDYDEYTEPEVDAYTLF